MMHSAPQDTRKNRLFGLLAALAYVLAWLLLLLFTHFNIRVEDNTDEGILVNFGTTETGWGEEDLAASDEMSGAAPASQAASQQKPAEVLTQEEESPASVVSPNTPRQTVRQPSVQPTRPAEEAPVAEQPRQVNQRALFPGRTAGSQSTSEGTAGGAGNQGNPAGDPAGSHDGTGLGTSGVSSYKLEGRSIVGALPKPAYTAPEEGRVVIEIDVDQQGRVTRAAFRSVGSTTTNSTLVAAAERAARQARFNVDETAPFPQRGTITYLFRMQ